MRATLDAVPATLQASGPLDWLPLVDALADARNLFVVGRGVGLAASREAALKLEETRGLHADACSAAEVQHGQMSLVGRVSRYCSSRRPTPPRRARST